MQSSDTQTPPPLPHPLAGARGRLGAARRGSQRRCGCGWVLRGRAPRLGAGGRPAGGASQQARHARFARRREEHQLAPAMQLHQRGGLGCRDRECTAISMRHLRCKTGAGDEANWSMRCGGGGSAAMRWRRRCLRSSPRRRAPTRNNRAARAAAPLAAAVGSVSGGRAAAARDAAPPHGQPPAPPSAPAAGELLRCGVALGGLMIAQAAAAVLLARAPSAMRTLLTPRQRRHPAPRPSPLALHPDCTAVMRTCPCLRQRQGQAQHQRAGATT